MKARDLFIKLTDPTGKCKPIINHHRVWDGARFIEAQHQQYDRDANPGERRNVSESTQDEYRQYRQ